MNATPRFALPYLSVGQSQKEFTHNEALQAVDIALCAAVEEPPRAAPPSTPAVGATYIVAAAPSGAWVGRSNHLAAFTEGGWRFIAPFEGLTAFVRSVDVTARFRAGAWELGNLRGTALLLNGQQVVGTRSGPITVPTGGTVVDAQSRTALTQILAALRQHGLIEP